MYYIVNDNFDNRSYYFKSDSKESAAKWAYKNRPNYIGPSSTLYVIKVLDNGLMTMLGRISNKTGLLETIPGKGDFNPPKPTKSKYGSSKCQDIDKYFKK